MGGGVAEDKAADYVRFLSGWKEEKEARTSERLWRLSGKGGNYMGRDTGAKEIPLPQVFVGTLLVLVGHANS